MVNLQTFAHAAECLRFYYNQSVWYCLYQ